jgi:hypothetical protein
MRHARNDYNNRIRDFYGMIPDDEPVFLLRGQDQVAAETVRFWADRNDEAGGDPELSRLAREHADAMDRWPTKKPADL